MAKEEEAKDETEVKGGGKKKLIIIIVPIVLLLAGAGWFFFLKPKDSGVPEPLPHPTPGAVIKLDAITINLAGAHFLKFGMALQPTAEAVELDGSAALDLAIAQFSQMTIEELSTAAGRDKAKKALVARVKLTYLPHGTILADVTSTAAAEPAEEGKEHAEKEEEHAEETVTKETKKAATEEPATEEEHATGDHGIKISELSDAEAIALADSLTVQADVYDVYFTEFVMQ